MLHIQPLVSADNPFRYMWELGYRRLCPIIPPGAPVHPGSVLAKRIAAGKKDPRGKAPGILRGDMWQGFDFVGHESTEEDLDAWNAMGAGVGIKTGQGLIAVDIDTRHKTTARRLFDLSNQILGGKGWPEAPVRFGQRPKALMLYRISAEVPYDKVTFQTELETDPRRPALVEILTEGRQFVAAGVHPDTGRRYEWPLGLPPFDDLPLIDPADLGRFMDKVQEIMPAPARFSGALQDRAEVDQESLRGDPALVAEAVKHLPNDDGRFPTRDDWLKVGYAIKAALGPDREDDALDLFQCWSARWEGGNDPDYVEHEWARMKPPYGVGASYVYEKAEQIGGWTGRARQFFEPISPGEEPDRPKVKNALFEVLSIDDVLGLPDPEFLIDRHIPQGSLGFLYGAPGCGKSFIGLDMALHIAYGLPCWHGDELRAREGANVLYIAREGSTGFKARVQAWQQDRLLPVGARPRFGLIRQTINFTRPDDIGRLVETVRGCGMLPLDLVVVDTVSRSIAGADENSQKDMTLFVEACGAVQDAFGCAVMGIHHSGKNGDMRGSTVFPGGGDFIFKLERKKESKIGRLYCEKQKDAPDGWSEPYLFIERHFEDGSSLVPERLEEVSDAKPLSEDGRPAAPIAHEVLAALRSAWEAGEPWGPTVRHTRYAPKMISKDFGLRAEAAAALIETWEQVGVIVLEKRSGRHKLTGYRPAGDDLFA